MTITPPAAGRPTVLRRLRRGLLQVVSAVLIGDLIAATLVGPSILAGPAAGIPLTVALFVLEGRLARRIALRRAGPDEQRRLAERRIARRRAWARRLRSMDLGGSGLTYRQVFPDIAIIGVFIGAFVAGSWFVIASNYQPSLRTWSMPQVLAAMAGFTLLGWVLTIVYAVHLYERVGALLSWPVLAWLERPTRRPAVGGVNPDDAPPDPAEPGDGGWAPDTSHDGGGPGDSGD